MIEIQPLRNCDSTVTLPGSKSFTHRALIAAALAEGESSLTNALRSEDTDFTAQALEAFGVEILQGEASFRVRGRGGRFKEGAERIYLGNSGTSLRFLTAVAALRTGRTVLDGNERMRQRPIAGLLEGLVSWGVRAYSQEGNGNPPVGVESEGIPGGATRVRGEESSQYLSALLLVAPLARADSEIQVLGRLASRPYVNITLQVMADFGVKVEEAEGGSFRVKAGQKYRPRNYPVEGDASNGSYFLAAAAVTRGRVRVENYRPSSAQGDAGFLAILEKMGCRVLRGENFAEVRGGDLQGIEIDMNSMPDLVPTLAVTGAFARGATVMKNIGHLRLKESDRISDLARELAKMGVRVEEGRDWLRVEGGGARGAQIEPHEDHRLAMSLAVAGLVTPGVRIQGERCVDKSFPGFWETFKELYG